MNVFAELIHSVYDLKSYSVFIKDRKRKTFLFGFLLVFLYYLLTIIVPYAKFQTSTGGVMQLADEYIPDFIIENCTVTVDGSMDREIGNAYIFVNTDDYMEEDEALYYLTNYEQVLIMDSEKAIFQSDNQFQSIYYSEIDPDLYMTKTLLLQEVAPYITTIIVMGLIVIFVGMELLFFFVVLFVALLGMIVASCMQYHLTFGELYKLGIYTRTTPLLIKALVSFLPISIPFYAVISMAISLAYLAGAIKHMKTPLLENGGLSFQSEQSGPQENQGEL